MTDIWLTIAVSVGIFIVFICFQLKYFVETYSYLKLYRNFFSKKEEYKIETKEEGGALVPMLVLVGSDDYDLNKIISEINHYVIKTKGTTDFAVIQNKVERNLSMRYDQTMAKLSFPTNIGLMGTFLGVFLGILMFVIGFSGSEELRDASISNLLIGVLISMSTSFIGLFLTTVNSGRVGDAQKEVEEDKNEFYDFIQTELMPSLDVSLVVAISKLHETVDKFEPSFNGVISRFQETFDRCTKAFGESFETNVKTVSRAVEVMGKNMDKINENIQLQQNVLSTFRSDEVAKGLDKYVEAANHFVGITQSLNKFEEARRMMLAAAQEAINLQNSYSESLIIPREVAVRINQILDRVKNFEANIDRLGDKLNEREILGNDVVNAIKNQVNAIDKKSKIADSYIEVADGKLEDLYNEQTKVIDNLNKRYSAAISSHIDGFEQLIDDLTMEIKRRHGLFLDAMDENLNIEIIREDFSNLKKLEAIYDKIKGISDNVSRSNDILISINRKQDVSEKADSKNQQKVNEYIDRDLHNKEEVRQLRQENDGLHKNVDELTEKIKQLETEVQKQKDLRYERTYSPTYQSELSRPSEQTYGVVSSPSTIGNPSIDTPSHTIISQEGPKQIDSTITNDIGKDGVENNIEETKTKRRFNIFTFFRNKKS